MEKSKGIEWIKISEVISASTKKDENSEQVAGIKIYTILFMAIVCIVLTIMNIVNKYTVMTCATGGMAIGLFVAVCLYKAGGMARAGNLLVTIIIGIAFTFFAVSGRNEGFAILWIMLVPAVASNILNLKLSLILSSYFQFLLIAMFYTPLRAAFADNYTQTFCNRFPVLYFAMFIVSYIIVVEKEFYSLQIDKMARTDVLTGLANRREHEDVLKNLALEWDKVERLRVFSMDLNGLKAANDNIGHVAGDELIRGTADCLTAAFHNAIVISRLGGDEFCVISECSEDEIDLQMAHFADLVRMWRGKYVQSLSISCGSVSKEENLGCGIYELSNLADQEMLNEKRRYYATAGIDRRCRRTFVNRGAENFAEQFDDSLQKD